MLRKALCFFLCAAPLLAAPLLRAADAPPDPKAGLTKQITAAWEFYQLLQIKPETAASTAALFAPREGIRTTRATGGGIGRGGAGPQYPLAGAEIDYYLNAPPSGDVVMEVLDSQGAVVRRFTSAGAAAPQRGGLAEEAPPMELSLIHI